MILAGNAADLGIRRRTCPSHSAEHAPLADGHGEPNTMVKIARWNDGGEVRSGFIHEGNAYPLSDGMTTNDLLAAGLEETLRIADLTAHRARRRRPAR